MRHLLPVLAGLAIASVIVIVARIASPGFRGFQTHALFAADQNHVASWTLAAASEIKLRSVASSRDDDVHRMTFVSGPSMSTFRGQKVDVWIEETPEGSRVVICSKPRVTFQIYDWGEGARIATRLMQALSQQAAK